MLHLLRTTSRGAKGLAVPSGIVWRARQADTVQRTQLPAEGGSPLTSYLRELLCEKDAPSTGQPMSMSINMRDGKNALSVDQSLSLPAAMAIDRNLKVELLDHTPALKTANVTFEHSEISKIDLPVAAVGNEGHHAPEPFEFEGKLATGKLAIVDTPNGERLRLTLERSAKALSAQVVIDRGARGLETLALRASASNSMESTEAPREPHSFSAVLQLTELSDHENLPFEMSEPVGHQH